MNIFDIPSAVLADHRDSICSFLLIADSRGHIA
jgi:hypothetical protein